MTRRRRIYEGKGKILYEGPEPGTLVQFFKDDATAFNKKKHEIVDGKGVLNNRISEYIFSHLNKMGIPTHFIKRLNMREQLIKEVEIIPLEVVVRKHRRRLAGHAPRHRGRHRPAALDHRVLLQGRRARRPAGVRGTYHGLRLGEPPGDRRHHGAGDPRQRLPVGPFPRRRHPARRFQDRDRPPFRGRHDADHRRRRNLARQLPALGTSTPKTSSTRIAFAATWAASWRRTRRSRAGSAS